MSRKLHRRRRRQHPARCLCSDLVYRIGLQRPSAPGAGQIGTSLHALGAVGLTGQDEFITAAMNRPALGSFPPVEWEEWLRTGLMTVAPKGLDQLMTTLCGSSANGQLPSSLPFP